MEIHARTPKMAILGAVLMIVVGLFSIVLWPLAYDHLKPKPTPAPADAGPTAVTPAAAKQPAAASADKKVVHDRHVTITD